MIPVDPDGIGIARIAGSAEGERRLDRSEDEEIRELVPKILGLERRSGQQGQCGDHHMALHSAATMFCTVTGPPSSREEYARGVISFRSQT